MAEVILSEEEARNVCRHLMAFGLEGLACKVASLRSTLATVEAERDGLKVRCEALMIAISEAGREEMQSLVAGAEQDAKRWNWLRDHCDAINYHYHPLHHEINKAANNGDSFTEFVDQQLQEPTT